MAQEFLRRVTCQGTLLRLLTSGDVKAELERIDKALQRQLLAGTLLNLKAGVNFLLFCLLPVIIH